jgi:hypothetical protein
MPADKFVQRDEGIPPAQQLQLTLKGRAADMVIGQDNTTPPAMNSIKKPTQA